ncbi:MAG: DUF4124 domain-containing protein, partial [Desulfobacterales bacterium]
MKYPTATAILTLFWFTAAVSTADELYIWQDKSGVRHITQEAPPEGAHTNSVIGYTPQPEKEVQQYEQQQRLKSENQLVEQRKREAQEANQKAEEARREAQKAKSEANLVAQEAQKYIDTHNQNQYMRRAFKYERRKAAEDAD